MLITTPSEPIRPTGNKFNYYFAFGSNMDAAQMTRRCPSAVPVGIAYLPQHRLAFGGYSSFRNGGVATILRNKHFDVPGIIWAISDRDLTSLDGYEGAPGHYTRQIVEVIREDQKPISCYTYKLNDRRPTLPSYAYWCQIRRIYDAQRWEADFLDEKLYPEHDIFVYGTLRKNSKNSHHLRDAEFIGKAETEAKFKLLHLGEYPGMVRGGHVQVQGEVYRVNALTLAELDSFEGHPTLYKRAPIRLSDGRSVLSYIFAQPATGPKVIEEITSGDWSKAIPRYTYTSYKGYKGGSYSGSGYSSDYGGYVGNRSSTTSTSPLDSLKKNSQESGKGKSAWLNGNTSDAPPRVPKREQKALKAAVTSDMAAGDCEDTVKIIHPKPDAVLQEGEDGNQPFWRQTPPDFFNENAANLGEDMELARKVFDGDDDDEYDDVIIASIPRNDRDVDGWPKLPTLL